ncbi:MAG: GTP-binding protein [Alphaproteobacteria bacterium]
MTQYETLIPINVITGFLGSGKTTVLSKLLRAPDMGETAVLINEFGEVGLDHQLIEHAEESTLLLENGCLCCAIRDDLKTSLRNLFSRCARGEIPQFRRVVIETSGLADPVPIAYTIMAEPVLQYHFRLGNIVTVVDAVNGMESLARYPESEKQAAIADRIVLSKTDLCEPGDEAALRAKLAEINGAAPIIDAVRTGLSGLDADTLLAHDIYTPEGKRAAIDAWLGEHDGGHDGGYEDAHAAHTSDVSSFCLWFDDALDWTAFGIWMTMLLNRHGDRVLRIKGMLNVEGVADPVLINGVQHVVHPPTHMTGWPDADRRSRIVFITRGISRERIEASLAAFNALANPAQSGRAGVAAE